jgi:hypothetical protein
MIQRANSRYSQLESICRQTEKHFAELIETVKNAAMLRGDLHELHDILEYLPLATNEYDLTVARINNARRYLDSGEQAAAKYEIRQLIHSLRVRIWSNGQTNQIVNPIDEDWDEASKSAVPAA